MCSFWVFFFLKMRIRNLQCEAWGYSIIPPWMKLIYGSWNGSTAEVHKCSTEKVSIKCIRKHFCRSHLLDKFTDLQLRNLIKKTSTRRWVLDVLWNFKILNFKIFKISTALFWDILRSRVMLNLNWLLILGIKYII